MSAIHEFQARGREYKVANTAGSWRFRLLAKSPTSGFFETVVYSDQESIQADMLAELARLATQKAENLPDGSREFVCGHRWRIDFRCDVPRLFRMDGDEEVIVGLRDPSAPPLVVLAEQFAALGREQGFAQKIDSLESATRERIAALEAERDRYRQDASDFHSDCGTARRAVAKAGERIIALEQAERDSRAEVADLSGRLEAQKARADGLVRVGVMATEAMNEEWRLRTAAEKKLAILEGELVAAKTAAAGRARTEGDSIEMTAVYDGGNGGGYEPHVRLYVRRGDRIDVLTEERGHYHPTTGAVLSEPSHQWTQLPPLPPIEPVKAGAGECEHSIKQTKF